MTLDFGEVVHVRALSADADVLVVCEHASKRFPDGLNRLGLSEDAATSHAAWDPGAEGVAQGMARALQASLVTGGVSRLVYDCNRPPEAESAIPSRSEVFDIPGNVNLSAEDREERVTQVYDRFTAALSEEIAQRRASLRAMVTVHSFTPVYNGVSRDVEIGILHGADDRFAMAMMQHQPERHFFNVQLNEPYSATDGVAHTLDVHGAQNDLPNVMLEVRNDLIQTEAQQADMALFLSAWVATALMKFEQSEAGA